MIDWEKINWEKEVKTQNKLNLLECEKNIDKREYQSKIEKYCKKFDFDFNKVFEKAKSDPLFRAWFAKDAKKQNIYEIVLAKYINSLEFISDFKKLISSGKNAQYIDRGVIRKGNEYPPNIRKPVKSIDFYWNIKNEKGETIHFYAFHKYTKESGGGQDNQFNDVKKSIEVSRNGDHEAKRKILFICDGPYFNEKRIKELKNFTSGENCIVLRSNELSNYLLKIYKEHQNSTKNPSCVKE